MCKKEEVGGEGKGGKKTIKTQSIKCDIYIIFITMSSDYMIIT
jgi:hypothetical protein